MSASKGRERALARARARVDAEARARARALGEPRASDAPRAAPEPTFGKAALLSLAAVSLALFAVRLYAASTVGFGDSEALYATWAAHPQPAYLDHPGLIGVVARAIGEGAIPSPMAAHAVTSVVATLVPWLAFGAARTFGASRGAAATAGLAVALAPETAVGLFALTPDLLLAPAWLGSLALAAIGLRGPAGASRSAAAFVAAGLLAGIGATAKVSGLLCGAALLSAYVTAARAPASGAGPAWARARAAVRTPWPWAGLLAGLVTLLPVALHEAQTGWPMLRHRFVDTQAGAGVAARNVGALLGGQLLYLSPLLAVLAAVIARDLVRQRARDPLARLLFVAFAVPFVPLVALCLWSPVAEPHWLAPALLALPIHAARRLPEAALASRRALVAALLVAGTLTAGAHAWVLVPSSASLLPKGADAKLDLASELYGWPMAIQAVKDQLASGATPFDPLGRDAVVVGPHWTVCAQLHAALPGVRVGCATAVRDDFDGWLPRAAWRRAERVLFVTDNRFPGDGAKELPELVRTAQSRVRVLRGGRTARVFEVFIYDRRAQGMLPPSSPWGG